MPFRVAEFEVTLVASPIVAVWLAEVAELELLELEEDFELEDEKLEVPDVLKLIVTF